MRLKVPKSLIKEIQNLSRHQNIVSYLRDDPTAVIYQGPYGNIELVGIPDEEYYVSFQRTVFEYKEEA